jgi:hypothetical protein
MPVFGKATALKQTEPPVAAGPADPEATRLGDPRRETRQDLRLQAICECANPPQRLECMIVDITGSGARVEFAATNRIPDTFKLYVSSVNVVLECQVMWREHNQLGVKHIIKPLA